MKYFLGIILILIVIAANAKANELFCVTAPENHLRLIYLQMIKANLEINNKKELSNIQIIRKNNLTIDSNRIELAVEVNFSENDPNRHAFDLYDVTGLQEYSTNDYFLGLPKGQLNSSFKAYLDTYFMNRTAGWYRQILDCTIK
jgi:hypothetical protein